MGLAGMVEAGADDFAGILVDRDETAPGVEILVGVGENEAVGWGAGFASPRRYYPNGVVAALVAIVFSLFAEWKNFPFVADDSFGYFITNVHNLSPIKLLMLAVGVACAGYFGIGRDREGGAG